MQGTVRFDTSGTQLSRIQQETLSKGTGTLLMALLAGVFLLLNRGAYQGYFQDDEIGALDWTHWGTTIAYLKGALTPIYADNFRAVGFYYFHALEPIFRLHFAGYVAVLQLIHILNVWLLWNLMRRLGLTVRAACAGCVFYGLHMALFDAVWKPMYIFDVLCATFCLLSLVLWMHGRWMVSFASFWLAFQAKELAVMLPVVLVLYEVWFGRKEWKKLVLFAAASCSWGVQGLLRPADGGYVLRFTAASLAATVPFYAERMFLVPYLGFLLPFYEGVRRSRRTLFGLAMMVLFFLPLIFLPGRVFSAYCYLPFTGLAIAVAGAVEAMHPAVLVVFFLLWMPVDIHWLRVQRNDTLQRDADIRTWITTMASYAKSAPPATEYVYDGLPDGFLAFGAEGAVKYVLNRTGMTVPAVESTEGGERLKGRHTVVLRWDSLHRRLTVEAPPSPSPN